MKKINLKYIKTLISQKNSNDENFPVSSFLVDKKKKKHIKNFYKFARFSDDIADNKDLDSGEKIRILSHFDKLLSSGTESDLIFINDLISTLKNQSLTNEYPRKLLQAFIMDSTKLRYNNWKDLINYCNHSASPVGRFVIDLHMKTCEKRILEKIYYSTDRLCNCLQILNHLQDIKEDFVRLDRVYLPLNFLNQEGINIDCLSKNQSTLGLEKVKLRCLKGVKLLLTESEKGLFLIKDKKLLRETLVIFFVAKKLANLLSKRDPLKKKIKLSRIDLIFCFFKGIMTPSKYKN